MAAKSTYSLYLAKPDVVEHVDLLTQGALDRIKAGNGQAVESSSFGDGAVAYYFPSHGKTPNWVTQFTFCT